MSLKDDLLKVGISNLVVLLSSLVNSFFLPSVLTINGYANFKTYILYASFIGFLHFGFVDGINVKYGGVDKKKLDAKEFEQYHSFFIIFQIFISLVFILISLLLNDTILIFVTFAIIPVNLQSFFLFFYQAIGDFYLYARATIIVPIISISLTLSLILLHIIDFRIFIIINIISYYVSIFFLEVKYNQNKKLNLKKTTKNIQQYLIMKLRRFFSVIKFHNNIFRSGFYIMLGTVLFNLFFSTGLWIIKFWGNDKMFAFYSLSLSLIGVIIIFVSTINKTFYPYLHKNNNIDTIKKLREILYILGTLSFSSFFILKFIIINYLPKYSNALPITAVMIISIPGIFIVKSIYANLYKVDKKESLFLRDTIIYLFASIIVTLSSYFYFKSLMSIAIASVFAIYVWSLYPLSFKIIKNKNRFLEIFYLTLIIFSFYIINFYETNLLLSILISLIMISLVNILFFKQTFLSLIRIKL